MGSLSQEQLDIITDLENESEQIRNSWSCQDHIQNGDEEDIDCGGSECAPCMAGLTLPSTNKDMTIFPNPAYTSITVSSPFVIDNITCTSYLGAQVWETNGLHENSININIEALNKGVYFLLISTDKGTYTRKITIQ